VDVKELVNEMEGEADDPAVSQVSSLRHKGGRVFRRNICLYGRGRRMRVSFPCGRRSWSWRSVWRGAYTPSMRCYNRQGRWGRLYVSYRSFVISSAPYTETKKSTSQSSYYFCNSTKMNNHLQIQAQARINKLTFLLDKSTIYAKIIGDRMARQQIEKRKAEKRAETIKANKEKKGDAVTVRESTRDKKPKVKEEEVEESGKRKRKGDAIGSSKKVKVEDQVSTTLNQERGELISETCCQGRRDQWRREARSQGRREGR
jgi:hypothetical protein